SLATGKKGTQLLRSSVPGLGDTAFKQCPLLQASLATGKRGHSSCGAVSPASGTLLSSSVPFFRPASPQEEGDTAPAEQCPRPRGRCFQAVSPSSGQPRHRKKGTQLLRSSVPGLGDTAFKQCPLL